MQETDLEVQEAKLAEEQACVLHSFDRRDLSMELEKLHVWRGLSMNASSRPGSCQLWLLGSPMS
jgi:hypothetical protein